MILLVAELVALLAVLALTAFAGVPAALQGALAQAAGGEGAAVRDAAAAWALARASCWTWAGGLLALEAGRLLGLLRQRGSLAAFWLVPGAAVCSGLGLALQWGYADPLRAAPLHGPGFAGGVLLGGLAGGLLLALPWQPERWAERGRWALLCFGLTLLLALALFGHGPFEGSGARIHLLGIQPIELVKLAFALWLAVLLGRRAPQLRYQRVGGRWLQLPRPRYLLPALAVLAGLFALLFALGDLGPTLVLSLLFLACYGVVTLSWAELALVGIALLGLTLLALADPGGLVPGYVATRIAMWTDPWWNGLPGGDQLAQALWAFAAGGLVGQGPGQGALSAVPAGHTDLALAVLGEQGGCAGLWTWLVALLGLVLQGLWIGARNRTPVRMLLAGSLSLLLFCQGLVIFAGSTGLFPLTGIVVPFLSQGRTSMVVFLVLLALLGRMAVGGRPFAADLDDLVQLRRGLGLAASAVLLLGVAGGAVCLWRTVLAADRATATPFLTVQADGTPALRHDRRLRAVAARIPRGRIEDRDGRPLALDDPRGVRQNPLGSDLGTLLGPVGQPVSLPSWSLEGQLDGVLRGWEGEDRELALWGVEDPVLAGRGGVRLRRVLFTVEGGEPRPEDEARARRLAGEGARVWFTRLRARDPSRLVPLVHMRPAARARALAELAASVDRRSVRLSLDARLQAAAAEALRAVTEKKGKAGAVVVLDVDSGQVLARAQWPDYDPSAPETWLPQVLAGDPAFMGSYGPWQDKTGIRGLYQAGSVFKLASALAWARTGGERLGAACAAGSVQRFPCAHARPGDRYPSFRAPGWGEPIRDFHRTADGQPDLAEALGVSCNVFFAQLGLALGPEPYRALAAVGLEIDLGGPFEPGAAGSRRLAETAFGQGAARMHVSQAARMVAAVGAGGIYRKCPPTLRLDASCEERALLADPAAIVPILAGMDRALRGARGTATGFHEPSGVRVYGKTGTADDPGREDEAPYGIARHASAAPHSWFVALAEPSGHGPCEPAVPGRLAFAAVVPRGHFGSDAAAAVVERTLAAAVDLGYLAP